jgi:signal peptidase II
VLTGLAWDLGSKSWVFGELGYPQGASDWSWTSGFLWGKFTVRLFTHFNQGALFGIGQGNGLLFAGLSIGAIGLVLYWLFVRGAAQSWWLTVTLGLITAGALGNLYDRLYLHGCMANGEPQYGVRDFILCTIPWVELRRNPFGIHLLPEWDWPIFNFADTYLVTGAILLAIHSFRATEAEKQAANESKDAQSVNAAA